MGLFPSKKLVEIDLTPSWTQLEDLTQKLVAATVNLDAAAEKALFTAKKLAEVIEASNKAAARLEAAQRGRNNRG